MKYGLIAGNGDFPVLVLEEATRQGESLAVVGIKEETDKRVESLAETFTWIGIGQLGKMISFFKNAGVSKAMMAGQVKHVQLFSGAVPDVRMLKMLWNLPRRNTDSLIGGIAAELEKDGIELIDSTFFLQEQLAGLGPLTKRAPNDVEKENVEYGLHIANEIARLDLGQTIVVRAKACVAIEAMEGTDATITRAGQLANGRLTVVKVAKPDQDMRFDVPVIGPATIAAMAAAGATCISVTAGKTLIFQKEATLEAADKHKIAVIGSPA